MDKEYKHGSILKTKFFEYRCEKREWKKIRDNHCDDLCMAFGDPHFLTFDGKLFSMNGSCVYTLMKYKGNESSSNPEIQINIQNKCRYIAVGILETTFM